QDAQRDTWIGDTGRQVAGVVVQPLLLPRYRGWATGKRFRVVLHRRPLLVQDGRGVRSAQRRARRLSGRRERRASGANPSTNKCPSGIRPGSNRGRLFRTPPSADRWKTGGSEFLDALSTLPPD